MELVFKQAGYLQLTRKRDSAVFLFPGMVEKIASSHSIQSTKLNNGNGQYGRSYTTGRTSKITVSLNSYVPRFYATLTGATFTDSATTTVHVIQAVKIPAASPYTITLDKTPVADSQIVHDLEEVLFTKDVAAATGKYTLTTATLTFDASDAGTSLVVAYDTSVDGYSSVLAQDTNVDSFDMSIAGEAVLATDEGTSKKFSVRWPRVIPDGDINRPDQSNTPVGYSVSFTVDDPDVGENVAELAYEK